MLLRISVIGTYLHQVLREGPSIYNGVLGTSNLSSCHQFHGVGDLLCVLDGVDAVSQGLTAGILDLQIVRSMLHVHLWPFQRVCFCLLTRAITQSCVVRVLDKVSLLNS